MATNRIFESGKQLSYAAAVVDSDVVSGDPVLIGTMTGVAITDYDATDGATVDHGGVYDLSVKGVNDAGNSAVAIGDAIYFVNADTPELSKKQSGYLFGYALETVGSGSTATIRVKQVDAGPPGSSDLTSGTINTADIADEAVTVGKMADLARGSILVGAAPDRPAALDANDSGKILVGDGTDLASVAVSGDATLAANGALTIADNTIGNAELKMFVSTEQTGTGSSQNVAHGLGSAPAAVLVAPTELAADLAAGYDCAEGAHDSTNVVVTVTSGAKFKVIAFAA